MPALRNDETRMKLIKWAEANGIDPSEIPIDPDFEVNGQSITFTKYVKTEDGALSLDRDGRAVIVQATVPLVSPLEDHGLQPRDLDYYPRGK